MTEGSRGLAPQVDFDHHDERIAREDVLWDVYASLRRAGAVSWSPHHGGFWILTGYDVARQALRDSDSFSSALGHRIPDPGFRSIPIDFDPPMHTSYRDLLTQALQPQVVRGLRPFLQTTITDLWSKFAAAGGGDVVSLVSLPLPLAVLQRVVGFSAEAVDLFHEHSAALASSATSPTDHALDRLAIRALLEREMDAHRQMRPDDYLTWLISAEVGGRQITDDEIVSVLNTLAVAGHETTMNAVSNLVLLLAQNQELQAQWRGNREGASTYVEEMFRLRAPAHMFARTTTRDVEIGGVVIRVGERVLIINASANRDEERYANAGQYCPGRGERGHLAFGWGLHQCVGAALARSELTILMETMLSFPSFELAGDPRFSRLGSGVHYGPEWLPIRFT